jgi:hypothetical protein
MACSNERSPHPAELFGEDWLTWGNQQLEPSDKDDRAPLQTFNNPLPHQP